MISTPVAIELLLWTLALPAGVTCTYLLQLSLFSWSRPVPLRVPRSQRFDIVIPAHNEAGTISRTLASLRRIEWPSECYRILVVADNCTDNTAAIASKAGADVIARQEPHLRGKGYALQMGFQRSLELGWATAAAVVDADSEVSTNLLQAFATRIENGAVAVQAKHAVLNPRTWRTRLLAIALAAFHELRSRAREIQGFSAGIRGNGWCVTTELLRCVPYQAFSLAEDLEYGITLGIAGYRVHYAGEASASQEMPETSRSVRTQRQRWEDGRLNQVRLRVAPLGLTAIRRRSLMCLDLLMDLLVPPLSYVALNVGALLTASVVANRFYSGFSNWLLWSLGCAGALIVYVLRGWILSNTGARGLLTLLIGAPIFVAWKVGVIFGGRRQSGWVRTVREHI